MTSPGIIMPRARAGIVRVYFELATTFPTAPQINILRAMVRELMLQVDASSMATEDKAGMFYQAADALIAEPLDSGDAL